MSLLFSSCTLLQKGVTREVTTTKFLCDTTLRINVDGYNPMVSVKNITDTAKVISKTGTSIAYVDPITLKINLSFVPNDFDVTIKFNKEVTNTIEKRKDNKGLYFNLVFLGFGIGLVTASFIMYKLNKL